MCVSHVSWLHLLAQVQQQRGSLGSELEQPRSGVLGYCVSVRALACAHMCARVYVCVRVCTCVCTCVRAVLFVILPVTRRTQSLPAPPVFLRSSFYHPRVDPGQTGSEVHKRGLNRKGSLLNPGKAGPCVLPGGAGHGRVETALPGRQGCWLIICGQGEKTEKRDHEKPSLLRAFEMAPVGHEPQNP